MSSPADKSRVSAIVVPRVTCDLPVKPVTPQLSWNHNIISDIALADPDFGRPSRIDLLLGVDIFVASLLHGRRLGPHGSPIESIQHLKQSLVGFWQVWWNLKVILIRSLRIMHLSSLETIFCVNSGKSKRVQEMSFSRKNEQLSLTSREIIAATKMVDL